ncbi:MAG: toll/interleukin-1 receptor domain-containing protein [Butyribacter sp.]|nr:toll/interleukin-1 receptor domain-containing protein [Butyribacter sp.]
MKYTAFISYRHGGIDEKVGTKIQREIERYRLPKKIAQKTGRKTLGKVFRDADDLRAASNLSAIIREGLDESEYLIVICTKRYKESVWCMEEIEYFMEIRGRDNIIVVLVEGEPYESFPKILTEIEVDGEIKNIEPLAVDVRGNSEKEILKKVSGEKLRFISQMLNLDYDDLRQRQKERRRKRIIAATSTVMAGLGLFAAVLTMKNIQLNVAYNKLDKSMQQTLKGQSYYLSEYANEAYQNGDRTTAALLAMKALPNDLSNPDRPYVPSVMKSLTQALGVYDYSSGYQADKAYTFSEEAYDTKVEVSNDKKMLLVERFQTAAGNMLKGNVFVYSLETRELLCSYELADISKTSCNESSRCSRLMEDNKTLLYLGKDGLRAVDIASGKKKFTGEAGSQMVLSDKNDIIAVYNSEDAQLYFYDAKGKQIAVTELEKEAKYSLYCISPDSSIAVLSQDAESGVGILLADTHNGGTLFANKSEHCSQISFVNDHSLCYIRQDTQVGRSHVVKYDLNENTDDYLVDTDKVVEEFTLTGYESCIFFDGKILYEINSKNGKIIWQNTYPSEIVSVKAAGDYLGVTLKSGESYFYNSKKQQLINMVSGNGNSFSILEMAEDYACLADYWGQNIRFYSQKVQNDKRVTSLDISSVNASVPEKWYTAASGGDTFLLDFKNGMSDTVQVFSADTLELLGSTTLKDMDYESFNNLSIEAANQDSISVCDYAYGENAHFDAKTMKKVFSFDDDSYYFYNDDKSEITIEKGKKLITYDTKNGSKKAETALKDGYDRGIRIQKYQIFGNDTTICIAKDGSKDVILEDAVLYTTNEKKGLVCYRNEKGTKWFVYSLKDNKVVCKGNAGVYSCTTFFDDGRYFLNDYSAVYDTKTWKKVLDLSDISTGVYGVSTNDKLPYFVVWYQGGTTNADGKSSGSNMAYLYSKKYKNEVVGVIPNYVATAKDGDVIVYDGDHTLYKVPLYTDEEILKKAKTFVKGMELTEGQNEEYHIFTEEE